MIRWDKLSYLSREEIERIQDKQIESFFRYRLPFSPYYREVFEKLGIGFDEIRGAEDLKKLPLTSKKDIAPTDEDPGRPKGFVLQPDEELIRKYSSRMGLLKMLGKSVFQGKDAATMSIEDEYKPVHIHFTTGRTAKPTPFVYSKKDIETIKEGGWRMIETSGIRREENALNAFPFAPHLAFWQAFFVAIRVGFTMLQTGGGKIMGTEKIADALESMKVGLLIAMPGYAYHVLKRAREKKVNLGSLEHVVFGGERVSVGLRKKVLEIVGELGAKDVKILSTYAFTEGRTAWAQCHPDSDYHTYPDFEFIEVVDEEGNRLPYGEKGEIVITTLAWNGTVVVRYRTGDITEGLYFEPCKYCGKTVPRIDRRIERKSEFEELRLSKVKGELVNLNLFFPLLSGEKDVDEWQVEIRKKNGDRYGLDEMIVYIAPAAGVKDWEGLTAHVRNVVFDATNVNPTVVTMSKGKLLEQLGMEDELKEKRIVDKRPKK